MNIQTRARETAANGHDALEALRAKAEQFGAVALPRAASAAEHAGKAVSAFALSSSQSLARSLRDHAGSTSLASGSALVAKTRPLLRSAAGIVRRNPLLFATAGVALAALSYAALRRRDEDEAEPVPV